MSKSCWVIVLGDYGRSPRMQYHTLSLLNTGYTVYVLAFIGAQPLTSITSHNSFHFHAIPQISPNFRKYLPNIIYLIIKALFQILCLFWIMLFSLPKSEFALVQIPPAIPTLIVISFISKIRNIQFILDWHNFAFTLMQLNNNNNLVYKWLCVIAEFLEKKFGNCGSKHICVSKAMQDELRDNWNIKATVLYDRPANIFRKSTIKETHSLFMKLSEILNLKYHPNDFCSNFHKNHLENETIISIKLENGEICYKDKRPVIIVSSTSWTPDEDFSILLEAAISYDNYLKNNTNKYPNLLIIVTGKGPLKEYYICKMKEIDLKHVSFRTVWLESQDYPKLLGCADLGISLHASSSGFDLPMKILDMFGSCLPVCALNYNCISELVLDKKNGVIFSDAQELTECFKMLFENFLESSSNLLAEMRNYLEICEGDDWDVNWSKIFLPNLS